MCVLNPGFNLPRWLSRSAPLSGHYTFHPCWSCIIKRKRLVASRNSLVRVKSRLTIVPRIPNAYISTTPFTHTVLRRVELCRVEKTVRLWGEIGPNLLFHGCCWPWNSERWIVCVCVIPRSVFYKAMQAHKHRQQIDTIYPCIAAPDYPQESLFAPDACCLICRPFLAHQNEPLVGLVDLPPVFYVESIL